MQQGRLRLLALLLQHCDLLFGGPEGSLVVLQGRGFFLQVRRGLLRALYCPGAGSCELLIAGIFLPREGEVGLGRGDVGARLLDRGFCWAICGSRRRMSASAASRLAYDWSNAAW